MRVLRLSAVVQSKYAAVECILSLCYGDAVYLYLILDIFIHDAQLARAFVEVGRAEVQMTVPVFGVDKPKYTARIDIRYYARVGVRRRRGIYERSPARIGIQRILDLGDLRMVCRDLRAEVIRLDRKIELVGLARYVYYDRFARAVAETAFDGSQTVGTRRDSDGYARLEYGIRFVGIRRILSVPNVQEKIIHLESGVVRRIHGESTVHFAVGLVVNDYYIRRRAVRAVTHVFAVVAFYLDARAEELQIFVAGRKLTVDVAAVEDRRNDRALGPVAVGILFLIEVGRLYAVEFFARGRDIYVVAAEL